MDDLFAILRAVNQTPDANQRELAAGLAMSVGKVNSLLHSAEEEGYLLSERDGKRGRLSLTDRGRRALEDALLDRQQMKLSLPGEDAAGTDGGDPGGGPPGGFRHPRGAASPGGADGPGPGLSASWRTAASSSSTWWGASALTG